MSGVLHTKIARQERIKEWISAGLIHSQAEVVDRLKASGFIVTQATASRDLEEIGAVRGRDSKGQLRYQLAAESQEEPLFRVGKLLNELLVQIQSSGNLLVLRTLQAEPNFLRAHWIELVALEFSSKLLEPSPVMTR